MDISLHTSLRRTRSNAVIAQMAKALVQQNTNLVSGKSRHVESFEVVDSDDLDNPVSNPSLDITYITGFRKRVVPLGDNAIDINLFRDGNSSSFALWSVTNINQMTEAVDVTLSDGSTVTAYRTKPYRPEPSDDMETFLFSRGVTVTASTP